MIDMHAHWRPAEVADALRARTREPRILRNQDGVEVLKAGRMGEAPLAEAFDDVDFHLGRMDRQGVEVSVLSMGNPHAVLRVDDVEAWPVHLDGPVIESHPRFPARVNAGFMEIVNRHPKLRVLPDNFFVAGQAIAVPKGNPSTLEGLNQMLAEILGSSLVKDSINRAGPLAGAPARFPRGR